MLAAPDEKQKPRVVIVGAGFGGRSLAKGRAARRWNYVTLRRGTQLITRPHRFAHVGRCNEKRKRYADAWRRLTMYADSNPMQRHAGLHWCART